jgi:hypothetical protein
VQRQPQDYPSRCLGNNSTVYSVLSPHHVARPPIHSSLQDHAALNRFLTSSEIGSQCTVRGMALRRRHRVTLDPRSGVDFFFCPSSSLPLPTRPHPHLFPLVSPAPPLHTACRRHVPMPEAGLGLLLGRWSFSFMGSMLFRLTTAVGRQESQFGILEIASLGTNCRLPSGAVHFNFFALSTHMR